MLFLWFKKLSIYTYRLASFVDNVLLMWLSSGHPSLMFEHPLVVPCINLWAGGSAWRVNVWGLKDTWKYRSRHRLWWPHGSFMRTGTGLLGYSSSLWPMINGNESGSHSASARFKSRTRTASIRFAITEVTQLRRLVASSSQKWLEFRTGSVSEGFEAH